MKRILFIIGIFLFISSSSLFSVETVLDNTLYNTILQKYLSHGKVDYTKLKEDRRGLDQYLKKIADLPIQMLQKASKNQQIAFYVNAYNAYTLQIIINNYPVKSIKDIKGVWDKIVCTVAGEELTLNEIEHGILRKQFQEPRIHFALVCASRGCPVLLNKDYTGEKLDAQLARQTAVFLTDSDKNRYDDSRNTLYLSLIFKWFRNDFGDLRIFVSKYFPKEIARQILTRNPKITYLRYDWALNDRQK
ncbi:DUF547 domain-containing protein [Chlamydiota bacterium]